MIDVVQPKKRKPRKLAEALRKLADDIELSVQSSSFVLKIDIIEASSYGHMRIDFEIELGSGVPSREFFELLREAHYSRD